MALTADKKSRIQEIVKGILERRIETFPADASLNRNAPFHDAFLSAFREQLKAVAVPTPYLVAIASWMHGLNTSMGTGFENIAHVLSGGYKKSFARGFRLKISSVQSARISAITVGLASGAIRPNRIEEDKLIMSDVKAGEPLQDALEFTADVYLESADAVECIELKSVRPNKGEGRGEKEKILHGKAALKRLHSKKTISFFVGFPFDPTSPSPTEYDKSRFIRHLIGFEKFFDPDEILVASELWDHLSGQRNTMQELLQLTTETVKQFCAVSKNL